MSEAAIEVRRGDGRDAQGNNALADRNDNRQLQITNWEAPRTRLNVVQGVQFRVPVMHTIGRGGVG